MAEHQGSWITSLMRIVLALLVLVPAVATFLPFIDTNEWWIRFLSFPRLQFLCALAFLFVLSVLLPGRLRPLGLATSLLAAVTIAVQAWILFPYSPIAPVAAETATNCPADNRIRVLEANVQMTNEHDSRLFDEIRATDPDILLFEEVDDWWDRQFAAMEDNYPHSKHYVTSNYYGITLLSKFPLISPQIHFLAGSRDPSVFAGVRLPSGDEFRFYGIHPRPPTVGQSSAERDAQISAAALAIADDTLPAILVGDMNAAPWSPIVRRAARIGHLLDPRIGRGWHPTWKANSVLLRWPLDEVLFSSSFQLIDFTVLDPFGSDHQPTLTTLCFKPGAKQAAPQPSEDDIAAAHRAIRAGQGKAAPSPEPADGKQEPN